MDLAAKISSNIRDRLDVRREDGWVIVIAIAVMTIMLGVGIAIAALSDTQIGRSNTDRLRESALNLAEGALTAQQYRLPYEWPSSSQKAYPAQCPNPLNANDSRCPSTANLIGAAGLFNSDSNGGIEFTANQPSWVTRVRDNNVVYPTTGWNDYTSTTDTNATWDANGDNRMWVRADGWIGKCAAPPAVTPTCKRRAVVGLVNLESFQEQLPANVLTTGGFTITPNSNQQTYVCVYGVDANGNCLLSSPTGSQVLVRCAPLPGGPSSSDPCEGYASNQIQPNVVTSGGVTVPPYMTTPQLNRFINSAQVAGTYCRNGVTPGISGFCPTGNGNCPDLTKAPAGSIVVADPDSPLTSCSYTGQDVYNIAIFIMTSGSLTIGGKIVFNGVIYHTNGCSPSNPSPNDETNCPAAFLNVGTRLDPQVSIQGTARVNGSIAVDGLGFTVLGSSSAGALAFNPSAGQLVTVGAAGLVQSTWRELPANQS
jgi:hypothetical protein